MNANIHIWWVGGLLVFIIFPANQSIAFTSANPPYRTAHFMIPQGMAKVTRSADSINFIVSPLTQVFEPPCEG